MKQWQVGHNLNKNITILTPLKSELIPYLEKYGSHCMAYTSLETELEYFFLDNIGYIAFKRFKDWFWAINERIIVLADPICSEDDKELILDKFLQVHPNVIFVQSSRAFAEILNNKGYQVNQRGRN